MTDLLARKGGNVKAPFCKTHALRNTNGSMPNSCSRVGALHRSRGGEDELHLEAKVLSANELHLEVLTDKESLE